MNIARIVLAGALVSAAVSLYAKPARHSAILPPAPSPAELVEARQSAMDLSAATLTLLRGSAANGAPLKSLSFPAIGLAKWGAALPGLFARSTSGLSSRALPQVWSNRADFEEKAKALADSARALATAAAAEDRAAFDSALASTAAACKGCHELYQAAPPVAKTS